MIAIDMEMPANCYECPLNSRCDDCGKRYNYCVLTGASLGLARRIGGKLYDLSNGTLRERATNCPLREVKGDDDGTGD